MKEKRIKRVFNVEKSKGQERDWKPPPRAGLAGALPSVDLRASWWPAENQGSTGACVGFTVAEGLCRWHFTLAGKLTPGTRMNWRFPWMGSKEENTDWRPASFIDSWGTNIKDALDIARKYGNVPGNIWSALSSSSNNTYKGSYSFLYQEAAKMKIAAYYSLGGHSPDVWREWLSTNGPIAVRFDVDTKFERAPYNSTAPLDGYTPGSGKGHAVCLVGYRADGVFIVRNSWGPYWGAQGHCYVTENYARAAFDEAYGVTL